MKPKTALFYLACYGSLSHVCGSGEEIKQTMNLDAALKKHTQELKDRNVTPYFVPDSGIWYECLACGQTWTLAADDKQKRPKGYWICPNGCNAPEEEE